MRLDVGDKFPDFDNFSDQKGNLVSLKSFKGKPFVFTHLHALYSPFEGVLEKLKSLIPFPIEAVFMFDHRLRVKDAFGEEQLFTALQDEENSYRDNVFRQNRTSEDGEFYGEFSSFQPVIVVDSNHLIVHLCSGELLGINEVMKGLTEAINAVSPKSNQSSEGLKSIKDANPKAEV